MYLENLFFNPKPPTKMHVDINSCFATIEQQANPNIRGRPVAVAPYIGDSGTIIAASYEAKCLGIYTGMKVREGKLVCKNLIVLEPDPQKYRYVHLKLKELLLEYTNNVIPKSIDEFVLDLERCPSYKKGMREIGLDIKKRIKSEIGDYITVSIGIAPNRFLAKTASNLIKPDGLEEINKDNYLDVYKRLNLMDLCGINKGNTIRLNTKGIFNVYDMYNSSPEDLKFAFKSISGYQWYLRLRGWEADNIIFGRKSYGNSYVLPKPFSKIEDLSPILYKLAEKTGHRLRKGGYKSKGIHVAISYKDGTYWHLGRSLEKPIFDTRDIYKQIYKMLLKSPYKKPVRMLAESCFNLVKIDTVQLDIFDDLEKKEDLVRALDKINEKWGNFVITPARMLNTKEYAPDRIAFGGIKELEEFIMD